MHVCQQEIRSFLDRNNLRKASILVALSGGPDSVALLWLLREFASEFKLRLAAAHLNYNLRGTESREDELFCEKLCRELGIKLHIKRVRHSKSKGNVQAWARELRYQFFEQLMQKERFEYTAVGHNRDDNIETIVMALGRGAGTFGLSGMTERRDNIIRPLLRVSRRDIEDYLSTNDLQYRTDRSNLEEKYLRNKVRRRLLPLMHELFGEPVSDNVLRAGQILAEHESYLREVAARELDKRVSRTTFGKLVLDLTRFRKYHPLIARVVVALCYEELHGSLDRFEYAATERLFSLVESGSGRADLTSGVTAELCGERIYIYRNRRSPRRVEVKLPGETKIEPFRLVLKADIHSGVSPSPAALRSGGNRSIYLDLAKLPRNLYLRNWKRGDRFRPLGIAGSKTLADFFTDRKIDRPLREEIPLLCGCAEKGSGAGDEVVWVVGYEIGDRYKLTERTKQIMKLEVVPYRGV